MKTAIFVDVQNIYYTTRDQFGRSFNYKSFWNQISSENKIIKANAYAIDKGDEKQQKFQYALKTIGFNIKLKPYISRIDGSAKGDWDVGITIDVMKYAKKADSIVLVSGDGDFDLLLKEIQKEYGTLSEVFGVRSLTSNTLIQQCTKFTEIDEQLLL